ncbi:hypothetical protein [Ciceribacter thiooxidans]|uniref:Uncharacterized protein n=1 Tax=Ciceribacter thiooxidans TaxID=1969821 RepID=A0ABV7I2Z5_9HYPH|nr:hypothetical protein [Ciceribacter thiooxidans]
MKLALQVTHRDFREALTRALAAAIASHTAKARETTDAGKDGEGGDGAGQ